MTQVQLWIEAQHEIGMRYGAIASNLGVSRQTLDKIRKTGSILSPTYIEMIEKFMDVTSISRGELAE